jgi:hypothetical protein
MLNVFMLSIVMLSDVAPYIYMCVCVCVCVCVTWLSTGACGSIRTHYSEIMSHVFCHCAIGENLGGKSVLASLATVVKLFWP